MAAMRLKNKEAEKKAEVSWLLACFALALTRRILPSD